MPTYACLYDVVWQTFAGPSKSDFTLFFWNQKFPIGLSSGRAYGSSAQDFTRWPRIVSAR